MKRILVIGSPGAGKSTLSRKLNRLLDLELIYLDQHFWQANWVDTSVKKWEKKVAELIKKDRWIIDGNYGGTMDMRMERADTIIYLDPPTYVCLFRIIKRILKYRGQVRPDMPPGCEERFDLGFLHYVLLFRRLRKKGILERLQRVKHQKQIHIFRNNRSVDNFIQSIQN